ncbi:MAG: DOMON-like domain-containing protein [Cyanobacteria bacterium P01_A01_bin.45]
MNQQTFSLQPFRKSRRSHQSSLVPDIKITGAIARNENNLLDIYYVLQGDLTKIEIPEVADIPARENELWETTCFEFFIGIKNSLRYWEFNLSPTGNWNIYKFNGYRQGMREEPKISLLPFHVEHQLDNFSLKLQLDLDKLVPIRQKLNIAISAVVKDKNRNISYWALKHCGDVADFHLRNSFNIEI